MTAASETIITTGVADARHKRYKMTLDIPNSFVKTEIALDGDKIIMNIRGQLVDTLLETFPGMCDKYVQYEGNQKNLHVQMLKALKKCLFLRFCTKIFSEIT